MLPAYKAGPFLGINTKLPIEKLKVSGGAGESAGYFVRDAVNVDIDDAGYFARRQGATQIVPGVLSRCLWSNGKQAYFASSNKLMAFNGTTAAEVATLCSAATNVSFADTPRGVVWSDDAQLMLISGDTSAPLLLSTPNPLPSMAVSASGSLPASTYVLAFAHRSKDGERSALSEFVQAAVPEGGAITLSFPAARRLDVEVFMSAAGGSQLYSQGVVPAAAMTARFATAYADGSAMTDRVETAMPAGSIVREHRGRLLVVKGSLIYFSLPYAYGLHHTTSGFFALDAPITLCEPVEEGVFVATARDTWLLEGDDITKANLRHLAPFGAIPNTSAHEPDSKEMWWFSERGPIKTERGQITHRQDDRIAFSKASNGAGLVRETNGMHQFVAVVSDVVPSGAANASSWMFAD